MVELVGVHKRYVQRGVETIVARDLSFRFEPGQSRKVTLVPFGGARKVYGFRQAVMGAL